MRLALQSFLNNLQMLLKLRCVILPSSRLSTLLVLLGCFVLLLSLHLSHCILCIDHIQDIWSFDNQYFSFLCIFLDIAFCFPLKPALMFIVTKDIIITYLCISCNISQPKRTHSFLFSSETTWWQIFINSSLCIFICLYSFCCHFFMCMHVWSQYSFSNDSSFVVLVWSSSFDIIIIDS